MDIFSDMNDYVMPSTAYAEPYDTDVGLSLDDSGGHQNEVSYGQVQVDYGQQPSYGNTTHHHQQTYYEHKEGTRRNVKITKQKFL